MSTHTIKAASNTSGVSCLICGRPERVALNIVGYGVCEDCEHRIVRLDGEDPEYAFFVGRFRLMWEGLSEAAAARD